MAFEFPHDRGRVSQNSIQPQSSFPHISFFFEFLDFIESAKAFFNILSLVLMVYVIICSASYIINLVIVE